MTDFEGFDNEEWTTTNFVYPTCRLVTSDMNMVKSSNEKMIGDELIDLLGLEVAGHVGGGTTDNAIYAIKEWHSTASRLLSEVKHRRAQLVLRWGTTLES